MGLAKDYADAVYGEQDYYPAWKPSLQMRLGDVGVMHGRLFSRVGNLMDPEFKGRLELPDLTEKNNARSIAESFQSKGVSSKKFHFGVGVDVPNAPVAGSLGLELKFEEKNDVYVRMLDTRERSIGNLAAIMDILVEKSKTEGHQDWWNHGKYRVVGSIQECSNMLIAISRSSQSEITFKAQVDVDSFGDAKLEWSLHSEKEVVHYFIDRADTVDEMFTPFMTLYNVHDPVVGSTYWEKTND